MMELSGASRGETFQAIRAGDCGARDSILQSRCPIDPQAISTQHLIFTVEFPSFRISDGIIYGIHLGA
jgi:hypothetical protein